MRGRANARVVLLALFLSFGCESVVKEIVELRDVVQNEGNTLRLALSLNQVSQSVSEIDTLDPELKVGRDNPAFERVADVVGIGQQGSFAVLDRGEGTIYVFSPAGDVIKQIGREGRAPGEFMRPTAMTYENNLFFVVQPGVTRVLTAVDTAGVVSDVSAAPIGGDWRTASMRGPNTYLEHPSNGGVEDLGSRIGRFPGSAFAYLLQPDELADSLDYSTGLTPEAAIITFDSQLNPSDTVMTMPGIPLFSHLVMGGSASIPGVRLFSPRPIWTGDSRYWAVGHGDSNAVVVYNGSGTTVRRVTWVLEPRSIRDEDRLALARWTAELTLLVTPDARAMVAQMSKADYDDQIELQAARLPFAKRAPELTALQLSGNCLLLSGFDPEDNALGESARWLVVDIATGEAVGVISVPGNNVRVRDAHGGFLYSTEIDPSGAELVARYRLPFSACS